MLINHLSTRIKLARFFITDDAVEFIEGHDSIKKLSLKDIVMYLAIVIFMYIG